MSRRFSFTANDELLTAEKSKSFLLYEVLHTAPVAVELYDTTRNTDYICHYKGKQKGHLACRLLNLKAHPAGLSPCGCLIFELTVDNRIADLIFSGHLIELFISLSRKTDQSRILLQTDRIGNIVVFSLVINGGDGETAVNSEFELDVLIFCVVFIQDRLEKINSSPRGIDVACPALYSFQFRSVYSSHDGHFSIIIQL